MVEGFEVDVADEDAGWGAFELDTDLAGEIVGGVGIVVDEDGHEVAVDEVEEDAAAGDDFVLVPVVGADVAAEGFAVFEGADEGGWVVRAGLDDLASPGDDAEGGIFGVELAGVGLVGGVDGEPEVGLRAGHEPVEVAGGFEGAKGLGPGEAGLAAVLDAAAAADLALDFELEIEVVYGEVFAPEVGVGDGVVLGGFADDGAVGDVPEAGVAFPGGEGCAVEERGEAAVVGEVFGGGLVEGAGARSLSGEGGGGEEEECEG